MNNLWLDQAIKESPKRAREFRDRFKFGMTLIALSLVKHDLEMSKKAEGAKPQGDDESEGRDDLPPRQDVRDMVSEVTSALAPFLLPLVETLSQVTGADELLSSSAGEAA